MPRQRSHKVYDFKEGYQSEPDRYRPDVSRPGGVGDSSNFAYRNGAAIKRPGISAFNSHNTGDQINNVIDFIRKDGTQYVIGTHGQKVTQFPVANGALVDVVVGLTNNKRFGWTVFNNQLIMGNQSDNNFKLGLALAKTNLGIVAPPAAPTFNANINGTMVAGAYFYRFTYQNSTTTHESNPSPASLAMNAAADPNDGIKINIPADGAADAQVDTVVVYRTLIGAPSNSEYFRVGTVAYNGGATTFSDTTPDVSITDIQLEFDHDIPPKFNICDNDGSYVYYAGDPNFPSRLWRSKLNDPESVPVTGGTDIAPDDGDIITAVKVTLEGVIVVFKRYSKYRVADFGGTVIQVNKINDRGTFTNESVAKTPAGLIYLNEDNYWLFNGYVDIPIGDELRSDITSVYAGLNVPQCVMGYDKITKSFRAGITLVGSVTNNAEYAYDNHYKVWSKHTKAYSALGKVSINLVPVLHAGTYDGYIIRVEDPAVADDLGNDINAFVKTAWHDHEEPNRMKRYKDLILWAKPSGNFNLLINFIKGFDQGAGEQVQVNLASGSLWGTFKWGIDVWGGAKVLRIEIPVPAAVKMAAAMRIVFTSPLKNQAVEIYKYALSAQILRRRTTL